MFYQDCFAVPQLSTWTVQHSLNSADTRMPLMQACLPPLINSTTGDYNSNGKHSTSLWLAFLTILHQGNALECGFIVLM